MNLLITGSSGFLGKIILDHFEKLQQFSVWKISRSNHDDSRSIKADLSVEIPNLNGMNFDLIIHCAGKAHMVPKSDYEMKMFYKVNVEGTKNLLKSIDLLPQKPKSFIFISTVAVYGISTGNLIPENTPLLATDPYGKSKVEAEKIIWAWGELNNIKIAILRLPLVVGENPPGNLGNLIGAIRKGVYFRIGDGNARKSMVLGKEVAKNILKVAEVGGIYNLTDGIHPTIYQLENAILKHYKINKKLKIIKYSLAKKIAQVGDFLEVLTNRAMPFNTLKLEKITKNLTFSDELARQSFGWSPEKVIDSYNLCESDIKS